MNDAGVVVGGSGAPSASIMAAFALRPDGNGNYTMEALPPTVPSDHYYATDINSSGMIVGCLYDGTGSPESGILWIDGNAIEIVGQGHAVTINDDGVVGGVYYGENDPGTAFVLVPEDQDGDGAPDTWFVDDDADGVNDLLLPLATDYPGYETTAVLEDLRVVIMEIYDHGNPAIVFPDFTDPDGDGNPWFVDANNDFYTDLAVAFSPFDYATAVRATSSSKLVGHVNGTAAVWNTESPVPSYTTLPGLSSNTTRSFVRDANDAGWAVGSSVEKINKKTSKTEYVFWNDGATTVFSAMLANAAVSSPSPWTINAAGIVAGTGTNASGEEVVFVGIPSEAP